MGIFSKDNYGDVSVDPVAAKKLAGRFAAGALALVTLANSTAIIGETDRGLLYQFGKLDASKLLQPGLNFKVPYVQGVRTESIAYDQEVIKGVQTYTNDGQPITGDLTYMVRAPEAALIKLARNNPNWRDKIQADILDSFKGALGKHEATKIAGSRDTIMAEVNKVVSQEISSVYGVEVTNVNMTNFDFTDVFEANVERAAAAKAQQIQKETEKESARIDAEKLKIEAEAKAFQTRTNADAGAYAIRATREAEAEGFGRLQATLGKDGMETYILAQKWKGDVPQVSGGGGAIVDLRTAAALSSPSPTR